LSSYRAFKKKIVKEIITYDGSDVYIDGLILRSTRNISIVPVEHYKRPYGSSNYNFRKLLSLWSDMAVNFPIRPIRIATLFGIIIFIIIFVFRKIQFSSNKNKKEQYIILEKTY
jgi:undecaprenyl-phosphate 4-deoxy-4-formamido-L-arabinose transferase